jgi:hypothetical protein
MLDAEYRTTMNSDRLGQFRENRHFVLGPLAHVPLFCRRYHLFSFILGDDVHKLPNCKTKTAGAVFEEIAIWCWGPYMMGLELQHRATTYDL